MNIGEVSAKFRLDVSDFKPAVSQVLGGLGELQNKWTILGPMGETVKSGIIKPMQQAGEEVTKSGQIQATALDKLKANWMLLTIAVNQALGILGQIKYYGQMMIQFGEEGAKILRVETAFNAVANAAGLMGSQVITSLKAASKGMMDDSDIMAKASRLIQENIPIPTLVSLMENLAKQAPIVGDTLPEAWDKFGDALSRGNLRAMRMYVGMVDMEAEYKKVADAMGVAVSRLSDEQKQAILAEVVNKKLADQVKNLGEQTITASERLQVAKASIKQSHEELQKSAVPIVTSLYEAWAKFVKLLSEGPGVNKENLEEQMWGISPARIFSPEKVTETKKYIKEIGDAWEESWGANFKQKETPLKALTEDQIENLKKMVLDSKFYYEADYANFEKIEKAKVDLELEKNKKLYREMGKDVEQIRVGEYQKIEDKALQIKIKYSQLHLTDEQDTLYQETLMQQSSAEKEKDILRAKTASSEETVKTILLQKKDQMDKSMAMAEALSGKEIEYNYAVAEDDRKTADERWKIQRKLMGDIADFGKDNFDLKKHLLDEEFKAYSYYMKTEEQQSILKRARDIAELKLLEEKTLRYGSFWDGMKVAYQQDTRNQETWGERGAEIWRSIFGPSGAFESVSKTFLVDTFHGHWKTAGEYVTSFEDLFINAVAEMMAKWAAFETMLTVGNFLFGPSFGASMGTGAGLASIGTSAAINAGVGAAVSSGGGGGGAGTGTMATSGGITGLAADYLWTNYPAIANALGISPSASTAATSAMANAPELFTGYYATGGEAALIGGEAGAAASTMFVSEAGAQGVTAATTLGAESAAGMGAAGAGGAGLTGMSALAVPLAYAGIAYMFYNTFKGGEGPGTTFSNPFIPGELQGEAAIMAAGGGFAMPSKEAADQMNADPFFDPNNMYALWMATFGTPPTADQLGSNGAAGHFFRSQPHWLDWVAKLQQPGMLMPMEEAYQMYQGYNPWMAGAAEGAIINEPMIAIGRSGKKLQIGEAGSEAIVPLKGKGMGNTYHIHFEGPVFAEKQYIRRVILPEIRALEKYRE